MQSNAILSLTLILEDSKMYLDTVLPSNKPHHRNLLEAIMYQFSLSKKDGEKLIQIFERASTEVQQVVQKQRV